VVQGSEITVLEAPTDSSYSATAMRLMREVAPNARVARVLVTHHHGDHVAGLGAYVAQGATLVVGPGLEEAVRRQLPAALRAGARFETATDGRAIGDGATRVVAYAVPNGHAEGNVAYFVPAAGVLFQGDLFYIPERGDVPAAFSVTADLARVIRGRGLDVRLVVGVHGRSGTWAEVERSLSLGELQRLHDQAREAHVGRRADLIVASQADTMLSVSSGRVSASTRERVRASFQEYFDRSTFQAWDDVVPPRIRMSPDGNMAYVIVEKRVHVTSTAPGRAPVTERVRYAWLSVYEKRGGEWRMTAIASTDRPDDSGDR
jgi:glyoxylase-like metal-dependent hydrolase (beta-lactamase superfamily II)